MSFSYASTIFTIVVSVLAIAVSIASMVLTNRARRRAVEAQRSAQEDRPCQND